MNEAATLENAETKSPSRDFEFIDTAEHLHRWVKESAEHLQSIQETRVCLDTEADSLHHYNEKLCLLQVACGGALL